MRSVLDDRMGLLAELDLASERQESIIASRDTRALLDLLAVRQKLVDRFVAGQAELLSLTERFESEVAGVAADEALRLRELLRTLSQGLDRVTARDEAAQAALRDAREETRNELVQTNVIGGARAAYRSSAVEPSHSNRFADRRA
jgi:hypothetical protein